MEPISNVDRLVLLLRQKLAERSKAGPAGRAGARAEAERGATGLEGVQALAALEGINERQLRRALIQSILTDQFGAEMINDARFQQVVDRVTETIEQDEAAAALLGQALEGLKEA